MAGSKGKKFDWVTIFICVALVAIGWINIYSASYNTTSTEFFLKYDYNVIIVGDLKTPHDSYLKKDLKYIHPKDNLFGDFEINHTDNGKEKTYNFYVDGHLIKTATYQKNKKNMLFKNFNSESNLKEKYFQKWKDEEEQKEAAFRNQRYAERLKVNGYRD